MPRRRTSPGLPYMLVLNEHYKVHCMVILHEHYIVHYMVTLNVFTSLLIAVRHPPTGNTAQRSQPERAHQTTDRPATQPPSPPARERPPTRAQQFCLNPPPPPPSLSCLSLQKLVSRSGKNSGRLPRATWRNITSTQKNNSQVVTQSGVASQSGAHSQ